MLVQTPGLARMLDTRRRAVAGEMDSTARYLGPDDETGYRPGPPGSGAQTCVSAVPALGGHWVTTGAIAGARTLAPDSRNAIN